MYYIKTENENGDYRDTDDKRYSLYRGTWVAQKDRWTWFESEEACLAAWGLTFDPPSPLQASVSAEATPRQDGVASPLPVPETEGFGVASPLPESGASETKG